MEYCTSKLIVSRLCDDFDTFKFVGVLYGTISAP